MLADRGKYIAAALTVVRAYLAAGCPGQRPALASFEDWSRLVRSALVWLGKADPVDTMEKAREEDPELDNLRRVFDAWYDANGGRPITAGELVELAQYKESLTGKLAWPALHDALSDVAWRSGDISPKALGHWLARYRGRIINGFKLMSSNAQGQAKWRLSQAAG